MLEEGMCSPRKSTAHFKTLRSVKSKVLGKLLNNGATLNPNNRLASATQFKRKESTY
jgi:hypothetical protein